MTMKTELIEAMADAVTLHPSQKQAALLMASVMFDAALSFLAARGLKVVPLVATEDMISDGREIQDNDCGFCIGDRAAKECWTAMSAAAPDLFAEADDGKA